jgi:hypothetical protein
MLQGLVGAVRKIILPHPVRRIETSVNAAIGDARDPQRDEVLRQEATTLIERLFDRQVLPYERITEYIRDFQQRQVLATSTTALDIGTRIDDFNRQSGQITTSKVLRFLCG